MANSPKKLYRSESDRVIAGVAGGLGDYFEIDPIIIRILFVVFTIAGGWGLVLYILMWLFVPSKSSLGKGVDEIVEGNVSEMKEQAEKYAVRSKYVWATILILAGVLFLMSNFGLLSISRVFDLFWPLTIILFGIYLIFRPK